MADGFVVLPSYVESIDMLPEDRRWPFFKELFRYRMDGTEPEPQTDLEQMALINIFPVVDASVERYEKNKENGEKGGRPRKWIEREEAERLYKRLKSWDKVADELGVHRDTLRKARYKWDAEKPKNQDIDIDKDSDIDSDKDIDIKNHNKKNKAGTPEALKGAPAPRSNIQAGLPGYEWVRDGVRYRITEDSEVEELGPV